ncbi:MAG: IS110 family transposase [Saprospiraceae bacterium]|nr:IS110 family transposase [Saprospiraceae bacterium]
MKNEKVKKGISRISTGLPVFNEHAAGIDIGDTLHYIAISDGDGGHEVKTTTGFTSDLKEIVGYLKQNNITTVAMESTGVYWLPLFILLEQAGIEPYLVNAAHAKNVTGRKKDDTDAIWLHKLHTCGLLQKSYQPENDMRIVRDYTRQRKRLINLSSDAVRRLLKALELMNIKIHTVISDILGKTGMSMVKAILAGQRDPEELAKLCDPRIKASKEEVIKSLEGIWKDEYLFMLRQAVEHYEFHKQQIKECEVVLEKILRERVVKIKEGDLTGMEHPIKKSKKVKRNEFEYEITPYVKEIVGVDISGIPGIGESTAIEIMSEIGVDMKKWKSEKNLCAWLNLAPNTKISGGKILSSKRMKKKNPAGQMLMQAASTLRNSKSSLGDYYRKKRAQLGGKGAVVATAHKMARIIYKMILKQTEYSEEKINFEDQKFKQNKIRKLEKLLENLKKAS